MIQKICIGLGLILAFVPLAFAEKETKVIINNKAEAVNQNEQVITAPAIVPSEAVKLRKARERQEIRTEDSIIRELEKQRLLDEQKRVDQILKNQGIQQQTTSVVIQKAQPSYSDGGSWFFGKRSLISLGAGAVTYPGVENVNSTKNPAYFVSFGGYGYKGYMIFDLSVYYSKHYLKTPNVNYQDIREAVHQPAVSMAIKFSPLSGKMKPYVGLSGSAVFRKWFFVNKATGDSLEETHPQFTHLQDVADKDWNQSYDAGISVGADLALGDRLGLNVDVRYHWNLYTENRKTVNEAWTNIKVLDEVPSAIISVNLRYYL